MKALTRNLILIMTMGLLASCMLLTPKKAVKKPVRIMQPIAIQADVMEEKEASSRDRKVERFAGGAPLVSRRVLGKKRKGKFFAAKMQMAESVAYIPTPAIAPYPDMPRVEFNTESYEGSDLNRFIETQTKPLSTFSIDVDTASYSNMRRFINQGRLPFQDSVRLEEMINYFNYKYDGPKSSHPFAVNIDATTSPWNKGYKVVRVALKGKEIKTDDKPASNLVFLLDVSGSMSQANKLPLLKQSMKKMIRKLNSNDRVAIVVYAGRDAIVLESTKATNRIKIMKAIDNLQSGGGTNAGAGIKSAYRIAKEHFIKGGVNRIVLGTDGDFNLGTTNRKELHDMIKNYADQNIFLTVLGFGMGNYKDSTLEYLTNKGNGNYFYIDTMSEADKVLNKDLTGTLVTIAKDVKIQVEFNPGKVQAYRLVGYENRKLKDEDFNNDKKDAGEIGAGHTVTALYEIVPVGAKIRGPKIDKLKYQKVVAPIKEEKTEAKVYSDELLTVKLRYKTPEGKKSKLLSYVLKDKIVELNEVSDDFRFAIAVASFGMHLRKDKALGQFVLGDIISLAKSSKGNDRFGYRDEFIDLMGLSLEIQASN